MTYTNGSGNVEYSNTVDTNSDAGSLSISSKLKMIIATGITATVLSIAPFDTSLDSNSAYACSSRDYMVKRLKRKYSETPTSIGLDKRGVLVEVFTEVDETGFNVMSGSREHKVDGGTWTMIVTNPNGCSYKIGEGEAWYTRGRPPDPES